MVISNHFRAAGLDPLFLPIFAGLATAFVFHPFGLHLREKWSAKLSAILIAQFVLHGFGGLVLFSKSIYMMLGMKKTSPAIASAMSNLAPGLIFIVAVCLRLEKFEVEYWYSRAKVGETFVCFSGAVAMSCFRSNSNSPNLKSKEPKLLMKHLDKDTYSDWILGCFYLLAAVVLQLQVISFQIKLLLLETSSSSCVITSVLASALTALMQVLTQGKIHVGDTAIYTWFLVMIGSIASRLVFCFSSLQMWCLNRKGPPLVAIFSPIQTLCAASYSFSHPLRADHKFRKVGSGIQF
ncbi:unnamed protein product [Musa acuminata var. zebrina]